MKQFLDASCTLLVISIILFNCDSTSLNENDLVVTDEELVFAPNFHLLSTELETISLAKLRGDVVLIDFWATWCKPCRAEMPIFNQLHAEYKGQGLQVVGVAVDSEKMTVGEPFVTQLGIDYTILFANDQVLKAYDITALPTAVVIDRQGNIRRRFEGAEGSKRTYEQEIKKWF